ncbi:MAG: hypothetical protein KIS83_01160 [Rubrivivax sp.]|nr:hypothetical protein [Rubrivivax sp.]
MVSSSRSTCSGSIGRIIQAVAPGGAAAPMKTVSPSRSVTVTRRTDGAWSASATR